MEEIIAKEVIHGTAKVKVFKYSVGNFQKCIHLYYNQDTHGIYAWI